jgi:hypothetical protein
MTPQDKNFIQRIQLQQLVSINSAEDNVNEDFYYIVHSAIRARSNPQQPLSQLAQTYLFRHGGRGNRRQDNHLQRMEQQVARAVAAAKARPKASQLVLEGSLGKISFSNVKTPRPMLNIKKPEAGVDQTKKVEYICVCLEHTTNVLEGSQGIIGRQKVATQSYRKCLRCPAGAGNSRARSVKAANPAAWTASSGGSRSVVDEA